MRKNLFKVVMLIVISLLSTFCIYQYAMNSKIYVDKKPEHIDLKGIKKLMIVAHPDDEMIWGGSHLMADDYLVVCITCGSQRNRVMEFEKVMRKTDDAYLMLGYPDKTKGKKDNWESVYEDIYQDLKHIIEYQDWQTIVTHNPDGEYGHIHHTMTSSMVSDIASHDLLSYFGKYYKKGEVPIELEKIGEKQLRQKEEILSIYASQKNVTKGLKHMFNMENWVTYHGWTK